MKKSFMLFVAFCGVVALLTVPGIAVADNFVITGYRDFTPYPTALPCVDLTNAILLPDPAVIYYTPTSSNMPGWVDPSFGLPGGQQHTYIINLPSPTGGRLQDVPGLSPITGVSGLLVLSDFPNLKIPTDLTDPSGNGWLDQKFLSEVVAIVAFVPGVSTVVAYENCTPPPQVPEPGVLLLLGSGLVALAGMRRVIKK